MILFETRQQQQNLKACVEAAARGLAFDASEAAFTTATVLVELRRAIDGGGLVDDFRREMYEAVERERDANAWLDALGGADGGPVEIEIPDDVLPPDGTP